MRKVPRLPEKKCYILIVVASGETVLNYLGLFLNLEINIHKDVFHFV